MHRVDVMALAGAWLLCRSARSAGDRSSERTRGVLAVRFCLFPNAIFTLTTEPGAVERRGEQVDLSSIPHDAGTVRGRLQGGNSGAFRDCRADFLCAKSLRFLLREGSRDFCAIYGSGVRVLGSRVP